MGLGSSFRAFLDLNFRIGHVFLIFVLFCFRRVTNYASQKYGRWCFLFLHPQRHGLDFQTTKEYVAGIFRDMMPELSIKPDRYTAVFMVRTINIDSFECIALDFQLHISRQEQFKILFYIRVFHSIIFPPF